MIKPKLFLKHFGSKPRTLRNPLLPLDLLGASGIFETMRAYGGRILALGEHLDRLRQSAQGVGRSLKWTPAAITRWVKTSVTASGCGDAYLRLMAVFAPEGDDVLALIVKPFKPWGPEVYRKGVSVKTAATRKNSIRASSPRIKSNQYTGPIYGYLETVFDDPKGPVRDPFDIIFLDEYGFLTEGTISNLMIVKNGSVFTADPSCGILLGVTRGIVKQSLKMIGAPFVETRLTRYDLYNADEAFLTTTLSEIMPVRKCDGRPVGGAGQGALTRRIHEAYRSIVRERIS